MISSNIYKYKPQDFARCASNPLLDQCKRCGRNVHMNPVHSGWQMWIGPWTGHGPCPNGDFMEIKNENQQTNL
jgi:hypothetical protein